MPQLCALASWRLCVKSLFTIVCENPVCGIPRKSLQLLSRGTGEADRIISHSVWILAAAGQRRGSRGVRGSATSPAVCHRNPPKAAHVSAGQGPPRSYARVHLRRKKLRSWGQTSKRKVRKPIQSASLRATDAAPLFPCTKAATLPHLCREGLPGWRQRLAAIKARIGRTEMSE
jgi:hypothetical protein